MSPRVRIVLWVGCALVAGLELPHGGLQLREDLGRVWERTAHVAARVPSRAGGTVGLEVASTVLHDDTAPDDLDR